MPHYIALIHKDADGCYGVSFPDIPGVFTGGDTIDEAMVEAAEVLQFAAEDWTNPDGSIGFRPPSTIDQLRSDPEFLEQEKDAVIAFVEFPARAYAAE
jgi:predicted RNase H-like HicB family nuclease